MEEADVVIVGAGVAGLATAVSLKRLGVRALVLEKAEGLRTTGSALGLSPNAWFALDALGIAHKLTTAYAPCRKGYVMDIQTGAIQEISYANFDTGGHVFRMVHRKALLEALAEELPTDSIRFSSKLKSIGNQAQEGSSCAVIHMDDGASIKAKALIGCDGVHSDVAHWLGLRPPVNSGRWAVRGLAVFPEGHGWNLEGRQFVTAGKRAGFVPLNDKELYWFLTCNFSFKGEDIAHDPELIKREVTDNFAKEFPQLYLTVVQHSDLSSITLSPLMFRLPWDIIFGNLSNGNVTVAGDAMHPMTPDMGQGGCSALEDAVVLGRHIGDSIIRNTRLVAGDQMAGALKSYAEERRWRAAGLITGSYLSGWVQQEGSGWFTKFLRDVVFYRLLYSVIFGARRYDCGKLPCVSSKNRELENNQSKID
ncbi:FAD-dependent urate hydroxylase [Morella rubra]|uniref:FAD-dependent urate hydroxylase n=1 Tax=Morella rubra TaxID=262757 RepID=A0A6A1VDS6_9ROSI|nr:FAD-dependent urate hydroxylase [Morella rubra]KAB1220066.1 FAD-dependent urate hydroxylase [Morella rubra]